MDDDSEAKNKAIHSDHKSDSPTPSASNVRIDSDSAKQVLIESCVQQIKRTISRSSNRAIEESYIKKLGFASLEALTVDIRFDENFMQRVLQAKIGDTPAASLVCYCSDPSKPITYNVTFRVSSVWSTYIAGKCQEIAANDLATSWNIGNYKRHIILHQKKSETISLTDNKIPDPQEDRSNSVGNSFARLSCGDCLAEEAASGNTSNVKGIIDSSSNQKIKFLSLHVQYS